VSETVEKLRDWLSAQPLGWDNVTVAPVEVQLGSGFSAEIFFIDVGYEDANGAQRRTLVVRRQSGEHEVVYGSSLELQAGMMAALHRRGDVPVPAWIGIETDPALLGAPFLVMGKVDGHAATQRPVYNVEGWLADFTPRKRGLTFRNAIQTWAKMAHIDWRDDFAFMAKPEKGAPGLPQYLGHIGDWHRVAGQGRSMPIADAAMAYVVEHAPADAPVNVLWGDPTPSNVMWDDDGNVAALIDWELAALGPAELDLAWWLYFDDLFSTRFGIPRLDGLPTRDETIALWEATVGRRAENLDYYDILVALRMALVAVGAFDRQVALGNIQADNVSLNVNLMSTYLAKRLGMDVPVLGPDFYAFMANLTPVEEAA
jgi:aminoglycoside phosphotransferase (APT) family kinase protein